MRKQPRRDDEYGFRAAIAELEDVHPPVARTRKPRRSPDGLRAAFAQLEDADDATPPPRSRLRPAPPRPAPPPRPAAAAAPLAEPVKPPARPAPAPPPKPAVEIAREAPAAPAPVPLPAARPVPRPSYSPSPRERGGGSSFSFSPGISAKHAGIAAAVAGVLALGYFGMNLGFFSGMSAAPVFEEVVKLNQEFEAASAKGPDSPEFAAFYDRYKPRHADLYARMGTPGNGTTAYQVKAAVGHLYSAVESFKTKEAKDEQAMYREQLTQTLAQVRQEMEG